LSCSQTPSPPMNVSLLMAGAPKTTVKTLVAQTGAIGCPCNFSDNRLVPMTPVEVFGMLVWDFAPLVLMGSDSESTVSHFVVT